MLDQTAMVRPGEELDKAKLANYLQRQLADTEWVAADSPLVVEQFQQGFSNLTYMVQLGGREMVLRRPPKGANVVAGHDMEREYRVLTGLVPLYAKIPRPVIFCADLDVLGVPFYLMERVTGVIIRNQSQPPSDLALTPAAMEQLSQAFAMNLATIHALDYNQTSLKTLQRPGNYVERQVQGWLQRYVRAKTDEIVSVERVGSWLLDHIPPDTGASLIHNDYKYDNMVLDTQDLARIVAVLDWEMATIGDPLMDLGTSLAYWIEPDDPPEFVAVRGGYTLWPGNFSRAQLIQHYALVSGRNVDNLVFYYAFGLFKLIVISQQIYVRFQKGYSQDERFGQLMVGIVNMGKMAALAIEKNRIDHLG